MGSGKTLGMVYHAYQWSLKAGGAPIAANFRLQESLFVQHKKINPKFRVYYVETADDLKEFVAGGGGLLLLDEIHRLVDSRLSMRAANIFVSQWFMFLRKLGITCMATHQFERQVDMRVRAVIDVMVYARKYKAPGGYRFVYDLVDWQTGRGVSLGQRVIEPQTAAVFQAAYDTYEFSAKLKFPASERNFEKFMKEIEALARESRARAQAQRSATG